MAVQAQGHIHLDTALGGAPENSPVLKFTALATSPELKEYNPHIVVEFAVDATTLVHQVTSGGSVVKTQTRPVNLRLTRATEASLLTLLGEYCYFVPPYHPDDGSDHTAYVARVYFVGLRGLQSAEKKDLEHFSVTAILQYSAA